MGNQPTSTANNGGNGQNSTSQSNHSNRGNGQSRWRYYSNREGQRRSMPKQFNLAVVGKVNSGKSSLIKALLQSQFQLSPDTILPITDALECTKECSKYEHPESHVTFWDVPGCCTQKEPLADYDKRIEMDKYDGFIVCCGRSVTEDEIALHNFIAERGRRYIFVRTKIDTALQNDKKAHPSTFDLSKSLKKIRDNIEEKLSESEVPVFLVSSNLEYTDYTDDFLTLQHMVFDKDGLSAFMISCNEKVGRVKKS